MEQINLLVAKYTSGAIKQNILIISNWYNITDDPPPPLFFVIQSFENKILCISNLSSSKRSSCAAVIEMYTEIIIRHVATMSLSTFISTCIVGYVYKQT